MIQYDAISGPMNVYVCYCSSSFEVHMRLNCTFRWTKNISLHDSLTFGICN